MCNCYRTQADQKNNVCDVKNNQDNSNSADKKKPHIKKPLNAFMLYMKEMRAKVVAECTLKESAAINQILGRKVRRCIHASSNAFNYIPIERKHELRSSDFQSFLCAA